MTLLVSRIANSLVTFYLITGAIVACRAIKPIYYDLNKFEDLNNIPRSDKMLVLFCSISMSIFTGICWPIYLGTFYLDRK